MILPVAKIVIRVERVNLKTVLGEYGVNIEIT